MKTLKISWLFLGLIAVLTLISCKKNPSVVKIFVRSASNTHVEGARVVIVSDVQVNEYNVEDVDTALTNVDGYAEFLKDDFFKSSGKNNTVAYFDIIVKSGEKVAQGRIRTRANTTSVETVYLPN